MILRLQTAKNVVAYKKGEIDEHDVALSIIQLRQLAEDLIRGADELEGRDSRKERRRRSWWP
jgi:hypothetical protein